MGNLEQRSTGFKLQGYCPMDCGATLYLDSGTGNVICIADDCPCPDAVTRILLINDGGRHVVKVGEVGYHMKHPLRERLDNDNIFDCELGRWIREWEAVPVPPDIYIVDPDPDGPMPWKFSLMHNIKEGWD